jgi:hypothetical protein
VSLIVVPKMSGSTRQSSLAIGTLRCRCGGETRPIRIGYARCSTAQQEFASQIEALEAAGCTKIFQEKISTRVKHRPEMAAAFKLARDIKETAPAQVVILAMHEMKRLARNAAEIGRSRTLAVITAIYTAVVCLTGWLDLRQALFGSAFYPSGDPAVLLPAAVLLLAGLGTILAASLDKLRSRSAAP